jgi:hypothetical protein
MCGWEYYGVATALLKNDNLTASYPGQAQPYWSSTVFAISGVDMSSIFDPLLPVAEHCPSSGDCVVNFNTSGSSDWIFVTAVENDAGCSVAVGGYRDWTLLTDNAGYSEVDYQVSAPGTVQSHSFSCPHGGGPVLEVADAVQAPSTSPIAFGGPSCGENPTHGSAVSTGSYSSKAGNVIVVVAGTMHGPVKFTPSMVTDTLGDSYSLAVSNNYDGIWTATARSTGTNRITFTNTALSTFYAICAEEYSNARVGMNAAVNRWNGSPDGTAMGVTVSGAAQTSWIVGGFISWDTAYVTMPSPNVARHSIIKFNLNVLDGDVPVSSSNTLTAFLSQGGTNWYGAAIELRWLFD